MIAEPKPGEMIVRANINGTIAIVDPRRPDILAFVHLLEL